MRNSGNMKSIFDKNIKREIYLNKIRPFYNQQLIKILSNCKYIIAPLLIFFPIFATWIE